MMTEESQCWLEQDFGLREEGHVSSYRNKQGEKVKNTYLQIWQGWLGVLRAVQAGTTVLFSPESYRETSFSEMRERWEQKSPICTCSGEN